MKMPDGYVIRIKVGKEAKARIAFMSAVLAVHGACIVFLIGYEITKIITEGPTLKNVFILAELPLSFLCGYALLEERKEDA